MYKVVEHKQKTGRELEEELNKLAEEWELVNYSGYKEQSIWKKKEKCYCQC